MKKSTKKLKNDSQKKAAYSESEIKRYLGALNEMHGENLKGIREGFVVINQKLDSHTRILGSHTEMIGSLMENMEIVKGDISIIKADLKKKVDYDEFQSLVRRVQKIEAKI